MDVVPTGDRVMPKTVDPVDVSRHKIGCRCRGCLEPGARERKRRRRLYDRRKARELERKNGRNSEDNTPGKG